ncbi:MAG: UPF0182 family protein [Bacteriovoracaceae bacterium]|jgi:uncharacterized protein|nr:UPF0182 family protein [Bacteriovoracaceae bacterium]
MYFAIIAVMLGLGGYLIFSGFNLRSKRKIVWGLIVIIATALLFLYLSIWGEYLWFESLGYSNRFGTVFFAVIGFAFLGGLIGTTFVKTLTWGPEAKSFNESKYISPTILAGIIGAAWGAFNWDTYLKFFNRISTGVTEPLFGLDTGFYLFSLPFMNNLFQIILIFAVIALLGAILIPADVRKIGKTLNRCVGSIFIILAFGSLLSAFNLTFSDFGSVRGAGWTDIHIRLPIFYLFAILLSISGIVLLIPATAKRLQQSLSNNFGLYSWAREKVRINVAVILPISLLFIWMTLTVGLPKLVQWLVVEPNEITFEKPYIERNIKFTRKGFNLDKAEEREFKPSSEFSPELITRNKEVLSEVRLWDWNALTAVYDQFQEMRLYYEFPDVDIDRYQIGGRYRQVMVSPREMEISEIPEKSQTFINKRFKYTHGYGITMAPVSDFTEEGLPKLVIKDIPPVSDHPDLTITTPQIYYGELTREHVFTNSKEKEFDYPSGSKNIYTQYKGEGGVPISSIWRKFLFGWKFDGTRFLLSTYPTKNSRVLFHRQILKRVQILAPFLKFDSDPYIVLAKGKLHWIIDAYTTSKYYPYSQSFNRKENIDYSNGRLKRRIFATQADSLNGANYVRNSVKIVVDAYNGKVDFYAFDLKDPIVSVWRHIFPKLFKSKQSMPPELLSHVRYPVGLLAAQGVMYAKYHMTDPEVFYNQEDLWVRATEKYYSELRAVSPYYVMWKPPGSTGPEFSLIQPFTPKNRQLMIGWLAGLSDGKNYGKLLVYRFPKESRVLGPQQVETKIDQDPYLSSQLTLWDQRGSRVIRGNVLAIPVENSLLYFEPIYLQAETAAFPELRLVVVMHGDRLSYGKSLDDAINGLLSKPQRKGLQQLPLELAEKYLAPNVQVLNGKAASLLNNYFRLNYEKRFVEAAQKLQELDQVLNPKPEKVGAL